MRLYVGNLSFDTTEQDLQDKFGTVGQVDNVKVIRDQFSGRSRGFAFVEMANDEQGRAACQAFDQQEFLLGRSSHRRHLRTVPLLPRASVGPRQQRP